MFPNKFSLFFFIHQEVVREWGKSNSNLPFSRGYPCMEKGFHLLRGANSLFFLFNYSSRVPPRLIENFLFDSFFLFICRQHCRKQHVLQENNFKWEKAFRICQFNYSSSGFEKCKQGKVMAVPAVCTSFIKFPLEREFSPNQNYFFLTRSFLAANWN